MGMSCESRGVEVLGILSIVPCIMLALQSQITSISSCCSLIVANIDRFGVTAEPTFALLLRIILAGSPEAFSRSNLGQSLFSFQCR